MIKTKRAITSNMSEVILHSALNKPWRKAIASVEQLLRIYCTLVHALDMEEFFQKLARNRETSERIEDIRLNKTRWGFGWFSDHELGE